MFFLLLSFLTLILGGTVSFFLGNKRMAIVVGTYSAIIGCAFAFIPTFIVLLGFKSTLTFALPQYPLPIGEILLKLDPLTALFLVPTLIVSIFGACFGMSYLSRGVTAKKNYGSHWFFYNILVFGLILTFIAADAFLFMIAWELMSIAPFFLIIFNDSDEQVRKGAWSYLIAAHIGALFLLAFFVMLSSKNGGALDFQTFLTNAGSIGGTGALFIFALIGFGIKAGLMPVHVWLPEAHPAAPGHVSAVMSGVMLNTGIYGIIRAVTFLGISATWWPFVLIGVGAFSAVLGIFFAIGEKSIKRALAYSSIENMGIVCMALGFALFAAQSGNPTLALLCALGGFIHLFNHSLYKSLLFFVAGSISKGTGTDILNKLGGLYKKAPILGISFFIGAAAICALPPLNGFAGELIMYIGYAVGGATTPSTGFLYWAGLFTLACASGFSLFCFTRLFGIAFLGNPRSDSANELTAPPKQESYTLIGLVVLCFLSAMLAPLIAKVFANSLEPYIYSLSVSPISSPAALDNIYSILKYVNIGFLLFVALAFILYKWRKRIIKVREVTTSPTWDCGYAKPSPRIQYTGGSFSQPAIYFMSFMLRPKAVIAHLASNFPSSGKAELSTDDWMKGSIYSKVFLTIAKVALWAKRLQQGRVNTYILYIFVTLVVLLAWKIR